MARGTGTTTQQLKAAPADAVYICNAGELHYTIRLAQSIDRGDLQIKTPSWLGLGRYVGLEFTGIVIDHNANLTDEEIRAFENALSRIR